MPLFVHDQLEFGDQTAWHIYLHEHWFEHSQFVDIAAAQTPVILIPPYDFTSWRNTDDIARKWLVTHESVHAQLRSITGVGGVDLSDVDLGKEDQFYQWIGAHRAEHANLRAAFGITT